MKGNHFQFIEENEDEIKKNQGFNFISIYGCAPTYGTPAKSPVVGKFTNCLREFAKENDNKVLLPRALEELDLSYVKYTTNKLVLKWGNDELEELTKKVIEAEDEDAEQQEEEQKQESVDFAGEGVISKHLYKKNRRFEPTKTTTSYITMNPRIHGK